MRNRNGFVSNSSSSSYIIAWKGDYDEDDLRLMFREVCKIPFESPIAWAYEPIFDCFIDNIDSKFDLTEDYEKWTKENCYMMDDFREISDLLSKGFVVRFGRFSTETEFRDPIQRALANKSFNYTSDDLVIIHEGNY